MNREIRNRFTGEIIIEAGKYASLNEAVEKNGADLSGANLSGADLSRANLYGADLSGADLYGANLSRADLSGANLSRANLSGANLSGANLSRANLSGANLSGADLYGANLSRADLSGANLSRANLYGADLSRADLSGADLSGANLSRANLPRADLYGANLSGANLSGANFLPDLYLLKLQNPELVLRAWKYMENGESPYRNAIYEIGEIYKENDYDDDERKTCAKGLNVATLTWCMNDASKSATFLEVEFLVKDIIAIPYATDGKFRVKKLTVLREIKREAAEKILKKAKEG